MSRCNEKHTIIYHELLDNDEPAVVQHQVIAEVHNIEDVGMDVLG